MDDHNSRSRQYDADLNTQQSTNVPQVTQLDPVKTKKIKKPLLGAIIATAIVLLGGGAVLAYNFWYQNPDKVLADSISNLVSRDSLSGDGSIAVSAEDYEATIDISNKMLDGQMAVAAKVDVKSEDVSFDMSGNAVYDKDGVVYVKVDNATKLLDVLIEVQMADDETMSADEKAMAAGMVRLMFEPVVEKIDGQWIKIDPEETNKDDESDSDMRCFNDTFKMLSDDDAARQELVQAYKDNSFMVADEKLGSKDGNLGFTYIFDEEIAKDFGEAVKETEIGKKAISCSENDGTEVEADSDLEGDASEPSTVKLEIWVDRWSHQLINMQVTATSADDDKANLSYTPNYDENVEINIPTDVITVDELTDQLGGMFN